MNECMGKLRRCSDLCLHSSRFLWHLLLSSSSAPSMLFPHDARALYGTHTHRVPFPPKTKPQKNTPCTPTPPTPFPLEASEVEDALGAGLQLVLGLALGEVGEVVVVRRDLQQPARRSVVRHVCVS